MMTTTKMKTERGVLKGLRRGAAIMLGGLLLSACSDSQDVNIAQEAVAHFHEMLSAGQFEQIYAQSDDTLKNVTTTEQLTRILSAIDRKLGAVKSSESSGWGTNFGTSGTSVTLRYRTQFEHGTAAETFVYRFTDGKGLLAGYNINSADLISN